MNETLIFFNSPVGIQNTFTMDFSLVAVHVKLFFLYSVNLNLCKPFNVICIQKPFTHKNEISVEETRNTGSKPKLISVYAIFLPPKFVSDKLHYFFPN